MRYIAKWSETFETADSRKRQRLGWLMIPTGNDSAGYIELMSHGERGIRAFGVFMAICQWSATMRHDARGRLARGDGRPMSDRQIASQLRMPVESVSDAIELLSCPEVAWICQKDQQISQSADDLPPICQSSATDLPRSAGDLPGLCKEKEKEKEKEKDVGDEPLPAASTPAEPPLMIFPVTGGKKEWPLVPSKVAEWQESFPGVDVLSECWKARQWCIDNETRRKTFGGMLKFLNTWMSTEQNRCGQRGQSNVAFRPTTTQQRENNTADSLAIYERAAAARDAERLIAGGNHGGHVQPGVKAIGLQ